MARLPVLDQDANQWGALLNEFLRVSHREDGRLQGVIEVFNVRDFGAAGDGIADDAPAIQNAAYAIPNEGGILYIPPGVYNIMPRARSQEPVQVGIELKSKTWVLGAGSASVIKASGNFVMILAQGVSGIRVSTLSFVFDVMESPANDYATVIELDGGASDIVIDSCKFEAINVPANDHITLHAVIAKGVNGLWVTNNRVYQMQIKAQADALAAGFNVVGPAVITGNYIRRPRNWGITALHFTDPTEIWDLIIANNVIEDPAGEGGIAVGTDSDFARIQSLKRIVIQGNILKGRWRNEEIAEGVRRSTAIFVRAAKESEQILIEGNVISQSGSEPGIELLGVKIDACTQPTTMKSLTIANNTIQGTELWGIYVVGDKELEGLVISGNTLQDTGGIQVGRGLIRDGIVTSNLVFGGGGLTLKGVLEENRIDQILVRDNVFRGIGLGEGIRLDASVANTFIGADVIGNRCSGFQIGICEVEAAQGQSAYDTRYFDNDLRCNAGAGLQVYPAAALRDNRVGQDGCGTE